MNDESIQEEIRGHFRIFVALLALALISAVASMLSDGPLAAFVMIIAAVQVALILAFLMHVKVEASSVRWLLALSGFFLVVLLAVLMLALADTIEGTESIAGPAAAHEAESGVAD